MVIVRKLAASESPIPADLKRMRVKMNEVAIRRVCWMARIRVTNSYLPGKEGVTKAREGLLFLANLAIPGAHQWPASAGVQ